jgi:hypothetical protein
MSSLIEQPLLFFFWQEKQALQGAIALFSRTA